MKTPKPETLQKWIENGEADRALAALKAIPEEKRTDDDSLLFALTVSAVKDWPTPSHMADLRQAISIFQRLLKKLDLKDPSAGYFNYVIALAYCQLGEYKDAVSSFRKAVEPGGEPTNQQMIQACRKLQDRPKDRESFRVRTQKAWAAFLPDEANLRKMMNNAIHSPKTWDKMGKKVYSILTMAFRNVEWTWWEGEVPRITLDPSRSKCIALAEQYFFSSAPKDLENKWEFTVGIRVPEDEDLEVMWEEGTWLCDMDVQVVRAKDDMLTLLVYHKSLDPDKLSAKDTEHILNMIYQNIGEMVFLSLIRSVSFSPTPLQGDKVKLGHLLSSLSAMGYVDREDIRSLVLYRHPYTRIPKSRSPQEVPKWRDDIVRGSTMDPMLNDLYEEDMSELGPALLLAGSGCVPCFVVFPLKDQTDNPPALMQTLLHELDTALDEDSGVVLGEAEGLQFGYLDLLAMDLQPALETAADVLRRHNIPWACWHSFFTEDRTVQLF